MMPWPAMSETLPSRDPVLLVVADAVAPHVVDTLRHALETKGMPVRVETETTAQARRRVLVDDQSRLEAALIEQLKTLEVAEAPSPTWRDLLPDAPQFRQTGPRPPRRYRRR